MVTLTYFINVILVCLCTGKEKTVIICHLKGKTSRKWANGLKIYDSEKKNGLLKVYLIHAYLEHYCYKWHVELVQDKSYNCL